MGQFRFQEEEEIALSVVASFLKRTYTSIHPASQPQTVPPSAAQLHTHHRPGTQSRPVPTFRGRTRAPKTSPAQCRRHEMRLSHTGYGLITAPITGHDRLQLVCSAHVLSSRLLSTIQTTSLVLSIQSNQHSLMPIRVFALEQQIQVSGL